MQNQNIQSRFNQQVINQLDAQAKASLKSSLIYRVGEFDYDWLEIRGGKMCYAFEITHELRSYYPTLLKYATKLEIVCIEFGTYQVQITEAK